jgi:ABC-type Fe3+/spermidine/putrescine transport system ATPase subunit
LLGRQNEVQRIAIVRAIAVDSELLLLDEPTANLDPVLTLKIEDLISEVIRQNAVTVIMATHDMSQRHRLADRMSALLDGEIAQTSKAKEILTSPRNREIAEFVGMENLIDRVVVSCEGKMAVINVNGTLVEAVADCTIGKKVYVGKCPEDISVALLKLSSSARKSLAGTITWMAFSGLLCRVEIGCYCTLVALITRKSADELELKSRSQVYTTLNTGNIHVIRQH